MCLHHSANFSSRNLAFKIMKEINVKPIKFGAALLVEKISRRSF